jgi:peptide/nickel transport system permease protein
LRAYYGLDRPVARQYAGWLARVVRLDFGRSFHDGRPVTEKIGERLPATLCLAAGALGLSLALAIPIGLACARARGRPLDTVVGAVLSALYSVPRYVMAMLLIALVGVHLDWFSPYGLHSDDFEELTYPGKAADVVRHLALIVFCFAYPLVAYQARFIRGNLLEVLGQDYIRTARAKGLSEWVVLHRHAFRNTLLPLITLVALLVPSVLGGSVILETMFQWPGIGQLLFQAMTQRDYPVVMALTVVTALVVLLCTLLADLAYAFADPRVRYG